MADAMATIYNNKFHNRDFNDITYTFLYIQRFTKIKFGEDSFSHYTFGNNYIFYFIFLECNIDIIEYLCDIGVDIRL
jgi:hypothetical protein